MKKKYLLILLILSVGFSGCAITHNKVKQYPVNIRKYTHWEFLPDEKDGDKGRFLFPLPH